jgi:RHS repeat-associated protein
MTLRNRLGAVLIGVSLVSQAAYAQSYSRSDTTIYRDDLTSWVLGQFRSLTNNDTGLVESQIDYESATSLPLKKYSFGMLEQTLTYHLTAGTDQTGTLATVEDGNHNVTSLSDWKRGVPQSILFPPTPDSPTGATQSAVVDDNGWVTAVTDANGNSTGYGYDLMGRMASIAYPTADSTVWNTTTQTFNQLTAAENGFPAGHWRQLVQTGNGVKLTYFDALLRPLVTDVYDTSNVNGTLSQSVLRYDTGGHLAFKSYPTSYNINYAGITQGVRSTYDALDRVTQIDQDSELGVLSTKTVYLPGFKTQVTNPRGKVSTTSYLAYDQPSTDQPVAIALPAGAYTDIVRDVFGKPTSIKRRNASGTLAATRSYIYDTNQRLCAQVEPETGTTLVDYDAAGKVLWSAAGLSRTIGCNRTDASVRARKVSRTYDARNRVMTLRFPDGWGDQDLTYTPTGQPAQVTAYNSSGQTVPVVTAYHYNKRGMLDGQGENLSQPGWYSWGIGYGYDANGNLSVQTYPDNTSVSMLPNALGQPTQVGTYATGVQYYPNGGLKQFTYGNGVIHAMVQNARELPASSVDTNGAQDMQYSYDADANVASIVDHATGRQTRTMGYDDLDRLLTTSATMFNGTVATYGYNELEDITSVAAPATATTPARNQTYWYDPTSRQLTNVKDALTGASVIGLGYDVQGNVANKNGQSYTFDFGNRLRQVRYAGNVTEAYRYDGLGRRALAYSPTLGNILSQYSSDGQLLLQNNGRIARITDYIYLDHSLVATRDYPSTGGTATITYQHTDALGTPVAVTDATGAVTQRSEYDPYGALLNRPITDGPGYTGHVQDAATGLTYTQQRYYDPAIGRFLSVDPVAPDNAGGSFNRYWYANDNPYKFTDPDGRGATCDSTPGGCGMRPLTPQQFQQREVAYHKAGVIGSTAVGALLGMEAGIEAYGALRSINNPRAVIALGLSLAEPNFKEGLVEFGGTELKVVEDIEKLETTAEGMRLRRYFDILQPLAKSTSSLFRAALLPMSTRVKNPETEPPKRIQPSPQPTKRAVGGG